MDTKWAPGEWRVEVEAEPEDDCWPEIYVCHSGTVCDATVVATMGGTSHSQHEERLANARLMASAPKLLKALQDIHYLRPGGDVKTCAKPRELVKRMEIIASIALAKATGETA